MVISQNLFENTKRSIVNNDKSLIKDTKIINKTALKKTFFALKL